MHWVIAWREWLLVEGGPLHAGVLLLKGRRLHARMELLRWRHSLRGWHPSSELLLELLRRRQVAHAWRGAHARRRHPHAWLRQRLRRAHALSPRRRPGCWRCCQGRLLWRACRWCCRRGRWRLLQQDILLCKRHVIIFLLVYCSRCSCTRTARGAHHRARQAHAGAGM
jgi:hypothetical protein